MLTQRDLALQFFCDRWPPEQARRDYDELFRFWHSIWAQTFYELKGQNKFYSDDFDRHDEISGIWLNGQVIGAFLFNWYDLSLQSHQHHSYFAAYPDSAMLKLRQMNAQFVMSMGNLAVHPEWRKTFEGSSLADAYLGIACQRFLESDADHLIAYTRNDRKVNDICYRHGARCLVANHREHNVAVDVIAITRGDAIIARDAATQRLCHSLWQSRRFHGDTIHGQRRLRHLRAA